MTWEHLEDVLEVEKLSFMTPWSREDFEQEIGRNRCALYKVLIEEGRVAAYGGMWLVADEAHITNIAVHPDFRKRGFGDKILKNMIGTAADKGIKSMTLEVRKSNFQALGLYEKNGFQVTAVRKKYYKDTNEDALIMWLYNIGV